MPVVAANSAPCNRCYYCRIGRQSLCQHLEFLWGAYAEYIVVPAPIVEQNLYSIPAGLSYAAAALTEPLACAVHAREDGRVELALTEPARAVAPGQLACLMRQDRVVGEGTIGEPL